MAIGEMVLFPTLRRAQEQNEELNRLRLNDEMRNLIVAAPGTSCRQQIWDGTKIKAVHPIEILIQSILP